jgi:hypothetical protein
VEDVFADIDPKHSCIAWLVAYHRVSPLPMP